MRFVDRHWRSGLAGFLTCVEVSDMPNLGAKSPRVLVYACLLETGGFQLKQKPES